VANYALTLAAVSVATLLRFVLAPLLGPRLPFILYYPTVFLCTTLGGVRAGLLSTALGGLAAWFIFIPPQYAFKASDPSALTHLILFLFLGVFISLFGENIFRTRKRSEDHLTAILESISDGFQSFDADYRYVYVNAVTKRVWAERGVAGDVIGRRVFDVFPEARDTEIGLALVRAMTGRVPVEVEAFSVILKRWVANRYFPTPDGGVLVFTQDITERKKSEEAMLSANEQLRLVTDIMAAPVTRCTRDLKYLWVSKPYADWLGLTPGEIVGLPIVDVIGREAFADLRPHFERVLSGEVVRYEEQVNFRGIGPRWIRAVYSPTFDPAGEPDGWVAVVIDIEDLKQAEEALKEANRHKDDFLALLGHELRNPLSGITNALHVLRQTRNADAAGIRALDVLERQTRQMRKLIDDLLEVTRITRGKVTLQREMADLVALVRSTVEDHRDLLDGARLALRLDLPSRPIWVEGDPTRLVRIPGEYEHQFRANVNTDSAGS
jgi:PAS domain S-box-containing protein